VEQGVKAINPETIPSFTQQATVWTSKYFSGREALINLMVQQVVRCRQGGLAIVNVLLQYGARHQASFPREVASEFLEMLLNEAAQLVQASGRVMPSDVPFLQSLQPHVSNLCQMLLTHDTWQQGSVLRLLTLMALLQGPAVSNHVITLLLQKKDPLKIVSLIRCYLKSVQGLHSQVVNTAIHEALTFQGRNLENALLNVLQLVKLEQVAEVGAQVKCKFQSALNANLEFFPGLFFQDGQIPHLAVRLLNSIRLPDVIHPRLVAKLSYSSVPHFFTVLSMRGEGNKKEAQKILATLSSYPNGQALILRLLMQGVFSEEWKSLFGAETQPQKNQKVSSSSSLLMQNRNFCSSVTLPQRHSSVFHAGIIGNGIRNRHLANVKAENSKDCNAEEVRSHTNLLLDTLSQCCSFNPGGMTQLSLLLVEIVSPDVMFNGLIWPEEEYTKVCISS
jgi:integrator complex subunit 5